MELDFDSLYRKALDDTSGAGLKSLRILEDMKLDRDKFEYSKLKKEKEDREGQIKATMGSLIDSYNSSKSVAMKEQIRASMKSFVGSVDPYLQPALDPYLRHSPISPEAEKEQRFLEMFPEPTSPYAWGELNGQPVESGIPQSEGDIGSNPFGFASKYFTYEDWKRKRAAVVLGMDTGEPKSFLKLPKGGAAVRQKDGAITIFGESELGFKEASEKFGVPIAQLISDEGYAYEGTKYKVIKDGKQVEMVNGFNVFDSAAPPKRKELSSVALKRDSIDSKITYPPGFSKFLEDFHGKNEKAPFAKHIRELIDGGDKRGAEIELATTFPGLNFEIAKKSSIPKKFLGFISYGATEETVILPHVGTKTSFGKDANGKSIDFYIDDDGLVRDAFNQFMGDIPQAKALIAAGQVANPKAAAKEAPPGSKATPETSASKFSTKEVNQVLSREFGTDRQFFSAMVDLTGFTLEELYYKPLNELKRMWTEQRDLMKEYLKENAKGGKK